MTEDNTSEMKDSRTFEERVFLRFDAMDARFESIETRLNSLDDSVEMLKAKQYDTKPIWEQALAAISEVTVRLNDTNTRIDQTNARMDQGFDQLRSEMKAAFANQQQKTEHLVRDVHWQMDALNKSILGIQADQQYFHARLLDVETTIRES